MTAPSCGLVLAPRRLVAVVLGPGGEARRAISAALTDDARHGLVIYLAAAGTEVVATESLVRSDPIAQRALAAGCVVWVVPDALVAAIAQATAITAPPRVAAILARLPRIPVHRNQLRRLSAPTNSRQVMLL